MDTVFVKKTNNPEYGYEDKDELLMDTLQHIDDVKKVLTNIGFEISDRGDNHDWSKLEYFDQFAQDTLERQDTPDFKQRPWYHIHTIKERHHINARVPEEVNLFDIFEMIADCCVAGKTRSGTVDDRFLEIPVNVLVESYWNTVKLIKENIQLEE